MKPKPQPVCMRTQHLLQQGLELVIMLSYATGETQTVLRNQRNLEF